MSAAEQFNRPGTGEQSNAVDLEEVFPREPLDEADLRDLAGLGTAAEESAALHEGDSGNDAEPENADEAVEESAAAGRLPVAGLIEVYQRSGLSAFFAALCSGVAIAWFARAGDTGAGVDWALAAALTALAAYWLGTYMHSRSPLLVADEQGVRMHLSREWIGLRWENVEAVKHTPSKVPFVDDTLEIVVRNPEAFIARLSVGTRFTLALSKLFRGGPFSVPLGVTTAVVGSDRTHVGPHVTALFDEFRNAPRSVELAGEVTDEFLEVAPAPVEANPAEPDAAPVEVPVEVAPAAPVAEALVVEAELAGADLDDVVAEVAEVFEDAAAAEVEALPASDSEPESEPEAAVTDAASEDTEPEAAVARGGFAARLAGLFAGGGRRRATETPLAETPLAETQLAEAPADEPVDEVDVLVEEVAEEIDVVEVPSATHATEIEASPAPAPLRAVPAAVRGDVVAETATDEPTLTADADAALTPVQAPAPWLHASAQDVAEVEAPEPVIGPRLRQARERLGLSIDQLSERTRIRPHVLEALEVDDFTPSGGDFYAKGHLRTAARVLGLEAESLTAEFEELYAAEPIAASKVFEAELSTGMKRSMRSTRSGVNWTVVVAVIMGLVLAWSLAQLILDEPTRAPSTPILDGSGGPTGGVAAGEPVSVEVSAPDAGAEVVVRDVTGTVVHRGALAIGEKVKLDVAPPVRVQSSEGSVTVTVDGRERGPVGEAGEAGQGTYAGD